MRAHSWREVLAVAWQSVTSVRALLTDRASYWNNIRQRITDIRQFKIELVRRCELATVRLALVMLMRLVSPLANTVAAVAIVVSVCLFPVLPTVLFIVNAIRGSGSVLIQACMGNSMAVMPRAPKRHVNHGGEGCEFYQKRLHETINGVQ